MTLFAQDQYCEVLVREKLGLTWQLLIVYLFIYLFQIVAWREKYVTQWVKILNHWVKNFRRWVAFSCNV